MPLSEIEQHPYLTLQESTTGFSYDLIEKVIIGTFPIYSITNSDPIETVGKSLRDGWSSKAQFKYFYGSKENHFWKYVSQSLNKSLVQTTDDSIDLLTKNGIYISDIFKCIERNGYSPSDSDLFIKEYNSEILQKITLFPNLRKILFTSKFAKAAFCHIAHISDTGCIQTTVLNHLKILLITLPTPSGNGRSVPHYFSDFPPTNEELAKKILKKPYAEEYRSRIYKEALK